MTGVVVKRLQQRRSATASSGPQQRAEEYGQQHEAPRLRDRGHHDEGEEGEEPAQIGAKERECLVSQSRSSIRPLARKRFTYSRTSVYGSSCRVAISRTVVRESK